LSHEPHSSSAEPLPRPLPRPLLRPQPLTDAAWALFVDEGVFGSMSWLVCLSFALIAKFGVLTTFQDGAVPWTAVAEMHVSVVGVLALLFALGRGELSLGMASIAGLALLAHWSRLYDGTYWSHELRHEQRVSHAWRGIALDVTNQLRFLAAAVVFYFGEKLVHFASWITPDPATYYVHPTPCANHGDGVECGIAYFIYPGGGSKQALAKEGLAAPPARKPTTFVCNVGHMFRERDNKDWLRLGLSTIHMSESLKTADAARKGFCGQYLAEFPADDGAVRQLNLTAWTDDAAAHDWYVNNAEHRKVVANYREGLLASFSSMLARLHIADGKSAKFHVRCLYCRALLTDYPEQRFCPECRWETHDMPLF